LTDSLYIHIPFCLSKCKYCDFYSITSKCKVPKDYVTALCREIEYRLKKHNVNQLSTIYIGGGTPSLLSQKQLESIFDSITAFTQINSDAEITIEVNPDDITAELLEIYKKLPINRISCGIQSLNNEVLSYCGRRADLETNLRALELFSKNWNKELSLDLISGLPNESMESFVDNLQKLISYKPGHISMYSLTIEGNTPFGEMLENGKLNYDFDFSDEMWLKGYKLLEENGYKQYEVSNFCLEGKESKHNLKYWNHCDYVGCGSGGTGTVYNKDGTGYRWTNIRNIEKYCNFWNKIDDSVIPVEEEHISLEDSKFEFFMMGFRKRSGVKKSEYEKIFKEQIPQSYTTIFEKWNKNKYLEIEECEKDINYYLNEKGILFLNALLEELI